jgi:hypothetical protein
MIFLSMVEKVGFQLTHLKIEKTNIISTNCPEDLPIGTT